MGDRTTAQTVASVHIVWGRLETLGDISAWLHRADTQRPRHRKKKPGGNWWDSGMGPSKAAFGLSPAPWGGGVSGFGDQVESLELVGTNRDISMPQSQVKCEVPNI